MTSTGQQAAPQTDAEIYAFRDALLEDIRSNRIILPSLPDVVVKIRQIINDPKADASTIARIISTDQAITARIVKVANSVVYQRRNNVVTELRPAIARLGAKLIHTLVTNLAIVQIMHRPSGAMKDHLEHLRQHSLEVASMSYALATAHGSINPELAMLSGMVHDIGALPILQKALGQRSHAIDDAPLAHLVATLHAEIGGFVLRTWGLQPELVEAAEQHENLYRTKTGGADYVDVLIVSDLTMRKHHKASVSTLDMAQVSAYQRLGIDPQASLENDPALSAHYAEMMAFLTQ